MRPFGIGFGERSGRCIILDAVPGKNADRAGICRGDIVERINDCADQTHEGMMAYLNALKTVHDAEGTKHPATRFALSRVLRGRRAGLQAVVEGAMNVSTKNQCFTVFRIAMANKLGSWRVQKRYSEFEALHHIVISGPFIICGSNSAFLRSVRTHPVPSFLQSAQLGNRPMQRWCKSAW